MSDCEGCDSWRETANRLVREQAEEIARLREEALEVSTEGNRRIISAVAAERERCAQAAAAFDSDDAPSEDCRGTARIIAAALRAPGPGENRG